MVKVLLLSIVMSLRTVFPVIAHCLLLLASLNVYGVDSCRAIFEGYPVSALAIPQPQLSHEARLIAALDFFELVSGGKPAIDTLMKNNENFRNRVSELKISNSRLLISDEFLKHHEAFFNKYKDPQALEHMQDLALRAEMQMHGATLDQQSARLNLQHLSRKNAKRLADLYSVSTEYLSDPEISGLVDSIEFVGRRNSFSNQYGENYMLSSRQLEVYGAGGGRHSKNGFNRNFLKSDDMIFFFVDPRSNFSAGRTRNSSEYGPNELNLESSYAAQHGWISVFVMRPDDLVAFMEKALPEKYDKQRDFGFEDGLTEWTQPPPEAVRMRNDLHQFDLTVHDFTRLMRNQLGTALLALKTNSATFSHHGYTYREVVDVLTSPSFNNHAAGLFHNLVYGPLRLGPMELKVPVAIPFRSLKGTK